MAIGKEITMSVYGKIIQNNKNISENNSFLTTRDMVEPPYIVTKLSALSSGIITSSNNVIDIKFTRDSSAIPAGYEEQDMYGAHNGFDYYANPNNKLQWCFLYKYTGNGLALLISFAGTTPNQNVTLRIESYNCNVYITYFDVVTTSVNNAPLNIVKLANENESWKTINIYSANFRTLRDHLENFPIFINVDV